MKPKRKNYTNSILQRFPTKKLPAFISKYQDFKAAFQDNGVNNVHSNKKALLISDMSSINNDRLSIDSLIFDKDINEHDNDIIELKNFIKKDSKLKNKIEQAENFSPPPLKSLNTTHNLNMTQKLFNDGYYSEEIENVKGRRNMYRSVRDLIKRQREHLNEEYKKLQNGNTLKSILELQLVQSNNNNNTNFFCEEKIKHS